MSPSAIGKMLLLLALVLAVVGGAFVLFGSAGSKLPLGRLPGDVSWKRGNVRFYAPLATSLLLSVVLTVLLNLVLRRR